MKNFGMITEREYVGKTLEDARKKATDDGFTSRVVEEDGRASIVTMDIRVDRINFRVNKGIVIGVSGG